MEEKLERIEFEDEGGEKVLFDVIEQTMLAGVNYLLVTDGEEENEEEAAAYIMREIKDEDEHKTYEMVEDDAQLEALSKVFSELLEDVDIEM